MPNFYFGFKAAYLLSSYIDGCGSTASNSPPYNAEKFTYPLESFVCVLFISMNNVHFFKMMFYFAEILGGTLKPFAFLKTLRGIFTTQEHVLVLENKYEDKS